MGQVLLVALTAFDEKEDYLRTRAAGFLYHFIKPVDQRVIERLMTSVR